MAWYLKAGVEPMALRMHVRADVLERQVEADVAVEVAIVRIAGIAFRGAPDLLGALGVAGEGRDPGRAVDRSVQAIDRRLVSVEEAMGVDHEVADRRLA
jgi:hypothetical protein